YLPNAVVAALSFTTGPGFSIGSLTVGMFGYQEGELPGVPLLAGIPSHHAVWWPALLLLPALVGALVGWRIRAIDEDPMLRMRAIAVAGAIVAFGCVILGTLSGGRLGDGPFDPVSVPVGVASVIAFCWIVVPGGFVAFFAGPHEAPEPPGDPEDLAEVEEEAVESEDDEPEEEAEAGDEAEESAEDVDETPARPEPEPEPEQDIAVTESTDGSGDESAPGDDR
ncbi:MAG TPA: DUF6350 family protein, partial [Amycolatopsis sp.]|nr:DUF6350 family protein [Amycolatopsis sp.]